MHVGITAVISLAWCLQVVLPFIPLAVLTGLVIMGYARPCKEKKRKKKTKQPSKQVPAQESRFACLYPHCCHQYPPPTPRALTHNHASMLDGTMAFLPLLFSS